jgi:hypothetical protein
MADSHSVDVVKNLFQIALKMFLFYLIHYHYTSVIILDFYGVVCKKTWQHILKKIHLPRYVEIVFTSHIHVRQLAFLQDTSSFSAKRTKLPITSVPKLILHGDGPKKSYHFIFAPKFLF